MAWHAFADPQLLGMQLGHLGMVFMAVGVVLSSQYSDERDLKMAPGDSLEMGGYRFLFEGAEHFEGRTIFLIKAISVSLRVSVRLLCCTRKSVYISCNKCP